MGWFRRVSDQEILDAKLKWSRVESACEPASAASVAGARLLRQEGVIASGDRVVCILTGHQLKIPTATVAYHTADQDKFNEVLGAEAYREPLSPTGCGRSQRARRHHQSDPGIYS